MEWIRSLYGINQTAVEKTPVVEEPLLLQQLWMVDSDAIILSTLDTDCDVNVKDVQYGTTPLHLAVYRKTPTVAQKLIEKGADLNARDYENVTPLHCALKHFDSNYETVYLLLYYGADVRSKCCNELHPFGHALFTSKFQCAAILTYYYDLDELRDDVNMFFERNLSNVAFIIPNYFFKELWYLLDHLKLKQVPYFFSNYLNLRCYNNADWIDCLYEIMDSEYAHEITTNWNSKSGGNYVVYNLLAACDRRNLDRTDRINIIYKFVSTGAHIHIFDIYSVYELCGFDEELEAFLHCSTISDEPDSYKFPIASFILLKDESSVEQMFINRIKSTCFLSRRTEKIVMELSFFSLSHSAKEKFLNVCKGLTPKEYDQIVLKLASVPEFPSLAELCRKTIRNSLRQRCFSHLYQFYDNVKKLGVPQKIIDVIIFKSPLY